MKEQMTDEQVMRMHRVMLLWVLFFSILAVIIIGTAFLLLIRYAYLIDGHPTEFTLILIGICLMTFGLSYKSKKQ